MNNDSPVKQRNDYIRRLAQLKTERASWFTHYQELSQFFMPRAGRFFVTDRNRGNKRHNNIYDSTGPRAARTLGAGMLSGMTSPARPWFRIATSDQDLMKFGPVKDWCADVTRIMLAIYAKSNTYNNFQTTYEELGVFGTSATIVEGDFDTVIRRHFLTTGEFYIAQDWSGRVCTLYREFQKTVAEIVKEYGRKNCSPTVQSLFDRGMLDSWVTLAHCIEPREDRDYGKKDAMNMPWRSCTFEVGASHDYVLRESGYKRFPVRAPRWDVKGGDIYGNSPGMEALGDNKQLQHEQLSKGRVIDYKVNPPLQVPTSMKDQDVNRLPGGISFFDSTSQHSGIRNAFEVDLDLPSLLEDIRDVRGRVNSSFYVDLFLMISNSVDTSKTATEVAELHEEKMFMIGPVLERLHNEMLAPDVEDVFERGLAAGIFPAAPAELSGKQIDIEFVSVLAQAQRAIGANGIDRFLMTLGTIEQLKPGSADKLDGDALIDEYSDILGVDPHLIVSSDKVALIRQARAQAQQQQVQAQQAEQQANTAAKLGTVQTQGGQSNAANDVMRGLTGYT